MKEYEFYIFDMDLTLLNTLKTAELSYTAAFKALGLEFDKNSIVHHLSISLEETFKELNNPSFSYEIFFTSFQKKAIETMVEYSHIYEDGLNVIRKLKEKGKTLGIVTNRDQKVVYAVLEHAHIKDLFSTIITFNDVKNLKPDPEPILTCIKRANFDVKNSVYIGDAKNDYIASNKAGIDFIAIERYNNCTFSCPTIIHSLEELIK
ncbi:MAG: HAD-IA family hydrolase [Bacillales bacterium]|nr:HAD-IA family hydrolase [Bacillales bacterium]